ncbi:Hypothetical protein NCS54_00782700 [Fusarium falciforme]|uniref:Hypothetical protein n=1 Tax=Fusarium falciforme TaxID=195108 RepID=UPI002300CB10|nr:Hypothetical protein NCS54_00782700 [Fusarium falciforme]WAO90400.1 Hypothetical protein NCS54_00782700 [Fusarium falciforme]
MADILDSRLKVFNNHSEALDRMAKSLGRNYTMFQLEFYQLLRFAFSDRTIQRMKTDQGCKEWKECEVYEARMRRGLGGSYKSCKILVDDIAAALNSFAVKLNTCVTGEEEDQSNKGSETMTKFLLRCRVTLLAPALEGINSRLRELLQDLTSLGEKMEALSRAHPSGGALRLLS